MPLDDHAEKAINTVKSVFPEAVIVENRYGFKNDRSTHWVRVAETGSILSKGFGPELTWQAAALAAMQALGADKIKSRQAKTFVESQFPRAWVGIQEGHEEMTALTKFVVWNDKPHHCKRIGWGNTKGEAWKSAAKTTILELKDRQ